MILLPRYRRSQPQEPLEIDRSNPITRGLSTVFLPTQRYPAIDLVTKVFDTATTRGALLPGTNATRYSTTVAANWSLNFAPVGIPASYPALSVFALFEQYDTTTTGTIFGGGNNSTQYARFVKNNDGSVGFTPNSNTGASGITGPVLNTNQVYALAAINQGNERELFVDAVSVASSSTSITFLNGAYGYAGSSFIAGQQRRIGLYCGYVWTRRLTPFEIKSLTDNPWQIFRPQRLQIPVSVTGTQTLTPSLYTNNQTFYSPTVTSTATVQPARYDNTNVFYPPTVSASNTLTPARYDNSQVFYGPTVTSTATIAPARYDNTNVFYSPTVSLGTSILYPDRFDNTNTFYAASIINEYPDPSQVLAGVRYGPNGTLVGTLTAGVGGAIIRLRSFTEKH